MTIKVGEPIPEGEFGYIAVTDSDPLEACQLPGKVKTEDWKGKKVVIFAVPGAFTPTCQEQHVPEFVEKADALKAKGVSDVYCLATNDQFVQAAFAKVSKAGGKVKFISDSDAKWLSAAGLTKDLSAMGMGVRASRFALIVDDGKVTYLGAEEGKGVSVSGADAVLNNL